MNRHEIHNALKSVYEQILDDDGRPIGTIARPVRFKLSQPHLARGGFLVVEWDEDAHQYVGTEFDALPHPRTGEPFPAGYSETVWRVSTIEQAVERVMANFTEFDVQ